MIKTNSYENESQSWNRGRSGDESARVYFDSLSLEAKEKLNRRAEQVRSVEELVDLGNRLDTEKE